MAKNRKFISVALVIGLLLLIYVGSYGLLRQTKVLIHTEGFYNWERYGRSHMVEKSYTAPKVAVILEYIYWPLCEVEARYHNRN